MINIESNKAVSKVNYKKALVFIARKKFFKPIFMGKTKSFTGYQNIGYFKCHCDETFDFQFDIIKGQATLAIVQYNNLYILSDETCKNVINLKLDPGYARLRLIGEKADVKYRINIIKK